MTQLILPTNIAVIGHHFTFSCNVIVMMMLPSSEEDAFSVTLRCDASMVAEKAHIKFRLESNRTFNFFAQYYLLLQICQHQQPIFIKQFTLVNYD